MKTKAAKKKVKQRQDDESDGVRKSSSQHEWETSSAFRSTMNRLSGGWRTLSHSHTTEWQHRTSLIELKKEYEIDEHRQPVAKVAARMGLDKTFVKGLNSKEYEKRLANYGLNELSPPYKTPEWIKFILTFFDKFSILLWIGAFLCLILIIAELAAGGPNNVSVENIVLVSVLVCVNLISGTYGYIQERRSSKILEKFKKMTSNKALVIRDGEQASVESKFLVPGDIVMIKGGDKVPADLRIIHSNSLRIDNSALTGESEPVSRHAEADPEGVKALEATCIVFAGTNAVEGTATALVIKTGDSTMMGRIAKLTSNLKDKKTLIAKEISEFLNIIMVIAIILGLLVGIYQIILKRYLEAIGFTISIIVANVPEGLILTVTVCLSMAARAMNHRKCRVKDLKCVETLGSTSCICTDKTGTLTKNVMTVSHGYFNGQIYDLMKAEDSAVVQSIEGSSDLHGKSKYSNDDGWRALMNIAALCNRAEFLAGETNMPISDRAASGDGSEVALLKYSHTFFCSTKNYRTDHRKIAEIPFNSVHKYQVSVHENIENQCNFMVMKGAPERVIDMCKTVFMNGETIALTDELRKDFNEGCFELSAMGERVLGFCDRDLSRESYPLGVDIQVDKNFPELDDFRFCGFISLIDPPRDGVPEAVRACREAGIKVAMVTGDHQATAKAIAKQVNIITEQRKSADELATIEVNNDDKNKEFKDAYFINCILNVIKPEKDTTSVVINGDIISQLTDEQLGELCKKYNEIVFARTSPQQKLIIVEAMQEQGYVTAVTGDGVNDAPALKKADIGIAMGLTGTDVSKESADLELMDDNFVSIVSGIEEGRRLFENLKKSIVYTLTSNIPEIFPVLISLIFSTPMILGAIPVLFIDVGTDLLPAISFAYEKSESDIMKQRPRNPKSEKLVTPKLISMAYLQIGIIQFIAAFFTYLVFMKHEGISYLHLVGTYNKWSDKDLILEYHPTPDKTIVLNFDERRTIQYKGYAAFLVCIVVVQYADLMISKTRRLSIFQHGFRNRFMLFALFAETAICAFFVYGLGNVHESIPMRPVPWYIWVIPIPFALLIFAYDELRKFLMRRYPNSVGKLIYNATYY